MNRRKVAILVVLAAAAAFVAWLSFKSRQPPLLPGDDTHARFESAEACLTCHAPDAAVPTPPKHPLGFDCLRCHGRR